MKILLTILFSLLFALGFSQVKPIILRSNDAIIESDGGVQARKNFYGPHTHGLTLNNGPDTLGAMIYEDSSFHYWYRDSITTGGGGHKWTLFATGPPGGQDTVVAANRPTGGLGFPISSVSHDTIYFPKLFCIGCTWDSTTNPKGLTITNTGILTASNGLNLSGTNVQLGGALVQNTTIAMLNRTMTFTNTGGDDIGFNTSGITLEVDKNTSGGFAGNFNGNGSDGSFSSAYLAGGNLGSFLGTASYIFEKFGVHPSASDTIASYVSDPQTVAGNGQTMRFLYYLGGVSGGTNFITPFMQQSLVATNASASTPVGEYRIGLSNTTFPATDQFILNGSGALRLSNYGSGTFTGTATKNLAVDASGNVIEVATGGGGGSGIGVDSTVTITSGSSSTVTNGYNVVRFNPTSVITSYTLTLPTTWHTSNDLLIVFTANGTITTGNPMVTTLTIVNGSGQTLSQTVVPNTGNAGESIHYHLISGVIDQRIGN